MKRPENYIQLVVAFLRSCWEHSVLCAVSTFGCVVVGSCCGLVKHGKFDKYVGLSEDRQIGSVSSPEYKCCQVYFVDFVERQSPV